MVLNQELSKLSKFTNSFTRSESLSGAFVSAAMAASATTTSLGAHSMASSKPPSSYSNGCSSVVTIRNGRTYLKDTTQAYPLPVDLEELNRQALRTLLLIQVFGSPMMALDGVDRPPLRILDVGCGSGFWSMMCHRHLKARGLPIAHFTGIDVAPLAPGSCLGDTSKPDRDMKWRFVQMDIRQSAFPFPDDEFDHVQIKDMALATPSTNYQSIMEEYLRVLRPGGTIELWETDLTIRMLRPHVPEPATPAADSDDESDDDDDDDDDTHNHNSIHRAPVGAYPINSNTPLSAPLNPFLVEYNGWVVRALEARLLTAVPCALMGPMLLQESDILRDVRGRRLAIPLSEVRWEREGVGGVVTKDGKSYVDWRGKSRGAGPTPAPAETGDFERRGLSSSHLALRRTALLTVVQSIHNLEPILREVSGKSQDEWDSWLGKMMSDLMREGGTSWGECMETGSWYAKKR